jgi:hypothetical protein
MAFRAVSRDGRVESMCDGGQTSLIPFIEAWEGVPLLLGDGGTAEPKSLLNSVPDYHVTWRGACMM